MESLQEYPGGGLSTILGTVASPPESSLAPAEGTAVASGGLAPSIMPPSSTAHTWGIAGAVGAVGVGAGDYAGGEGGAPAAASYLHGQLEAAGGIPSDPVLAMQMGARMALAGEYLGSLCVARARRCFSCFGLDKPGGSVWGAFFSAPVGWIGSSCSVLKSTSGSARGTCSYFLPRS